MPPFPIVDSHVHLWDPDRFSMPWLGGAAAIAQPFGPREYAAHSSGAAVAALVCVEAGVDPASSLAEAEWLAGLAVTDQRLQGVVAAAALEKGARVRADLEALSSALGPLLKGVRRLLQDEPDPGFCLQTGFLQAVRLLPEFGLSFDICVRHGQLPAIIELVRRCEQTSFILDHCGKPAIASGELDPWREHIRRLAELPNVVCKVSGLLTETDLARWAPEDLRPYVAHVLEQFGEDRVLFGSDWPVVLLASSYQRWVETLDALTADLSAAGQRKLWHENARRCYRLDP